MNYTQRQAANKLASNILSLFSANDVRENKLYIVNHHEQRQSGNNYSVVIDIDTGIAKQAGRAFAQHWVFLIGPRGKVEVTDYPSRYSCLGEGHGNHFDMHFRKLS